MSDWPDDKAREIGNLFRKHGATLEVVQIVALELRIAEGRGFDRGLSEAGLAFSESIKRVMGPKP